MVPQHIWVTFHGTNKKICLVVLSDCWLCGLLVCLLACLLVFGVHLLCCVVYCLWLVGINFEYYH